MKFQPLEDRILVRRIDAEHMYHGLIHLPEKAQDKPQMANVIAVGSGKYDEHGNLVPLSVVPGDQILFGKYSGTDIKLDDIEYTIMRVGDVLGIVTE